MIIAWSREVGRADQLFSDDAADLIHQTSRGLPRGVNTLALQALVATFAANKTIVDKAAAKRIHGAAARRRRQLRRTSARASDSQPMLKLRPPSFTGLTTRRRDLGR